VSKKLNFFVFKEISKNLDVYFKKFFSIKKLYSILIRCLLIALMIERSQKFKKTDNWRVLAAFMSAFYLKINIC